MGRKEGSRKSGRRRWRRVAKWAAVVLAVLVIAFIVVIGPWPALDRYDLETASFFRESVANLDRAAQSLAGVKSAPLRVGYGHAYLRPPEGCPLAGYGSRRGKPSVGTLDELEIEVLSLDNGRDEVVLVTADILLYTELLSTGVWERLQGKVPLDRDDLFFTASHTHNGPGGWSRSFVEKLFAGDYRQDVVDLITSVTARAIVDSLANQELTTFTFARLDAPEFVRNRTTRGGPVDDDFDVLSFTTAGGRRYLLLSYSAHPTTIDDHGEAGFKWSADYPGRVRRALEKELGVEALYMAGCLGSSSATQRDRIVDGLSAMAVEAARRQASAKSELIMAPLSCEIEMPPRQYLVGERGRWRLSPIFVSTVVPSRVHLRSLRLGDVLIVFCPCELSCEISTELKAFAKDRGLHLLTAAMNGEYTGYIVPDDYYGRPGYETRNVNFYAYSGGFYDRLIRELIIRQADARPASRAASGM